MRPSFSGSIRLFRFSGIQVYLHVSWFVVAIIEVYARMGHYRSPVWNVVEYLMLFATVTLHEFGHALACRQTGGQAHDIILWPLGGIAYVAPPQRPGATLWSIAAGPLVNVVLAVLFEVLLLAGEYSGVVLPRSDVARFIADMFWLNVGLLIFNLLPIYPLDGGQMLRSLLWFWLGRARSLHIAAVLGIIGIGVAVLWEIARAPDSNSLLWTAVFAVFLGQRCLLGLREAKFITAVTRLPRHTGFRCPTCQAAPPGGPLWLCQTCRKPFDPFSTNAVCPHCSAVQSTTTCIECGANHPIAEWRTAEPPLV